MHIRLIAVAAAAVAAGLAATAQPSGPAPVGPALDRPALQVRAPERAVLLAAATSSGGLVAVGERGLAVMRSADGSAWQQRPTPTSVTLTAVRFVDATHGVAVGHGGVVLTTADGGQTWQRRLDGRQIAALVLEDAKASGDAARLKDAERLVADGPDKPLLDVLAWDTQRLLVVGAYGVALHSADGGKTWTSWMGRLPNPRGLHVYAVRRAGDRLLVVGEQGLLLASDDGGATFRALASPYKGSWFTAEMPAADAWVIAGLRGNAWRTVDGGASWQPLAGKATASITASVLDAQGRLLLGNQAGMVLRVDGDSLRPLFDQPLAPIAALAFDQHQALWALTLAGPVAVAPVKP